MTVTERFQLPKAKQELRDRAKRIAWLSIGLLSSSSVGLALTVGQSQAMRTSFVSDLLSIIPPIGYLIASRYEMGQPTRWYPYGFTRAISVSFLVTASVLTLFGVTLFGDAVVKLVRGERPPIGTMIVAGHQVWMGWPMIVALLYSVACAVLVGRLKLPLAHELWDKELEAEAQMNKDEWMSEGVAILGLLLVGYGYWWGDAVAAAIVSLQILRDGFQNVRRVVGDLMDEAPSAMSTHELDELPARVCAAVERFDWVQEASVRLREHGRAITGDVFVVPRTTDDLVTRLEQARDALQALDWRLHSLTVTPVSHV